MLSEYSNVTDSSKFRLRRTLNHNTNIMQIAWSPDGKTLATGSGDKLIRLWDAHTGQLLYTLTGHYGSVIDLAWSSNGRVLASSSRDKTIRLWNVQTGQIVQTIAGHLDWITSIAWSLDGKMLASSSHDAAIFLWVPPASKPHRFLIGHTGWVNSVAWSPNGKLLASGSSDRTMRLWNVHTGQQIQSFVGHTGWVNSVAWSPNGKLLASGSSDQTIRLWNVQTGQQIIILEGHLKAVTNVFFSNDGLFLASQSQDRVVHIWSVNVWETVALLREKPFRYGVPSSAFHPKSPILATLGEEGMAVHLWEVNFTYLIDIAKSISSGHYKNAKVVLIGDSGVGKSGLSLVLTGQHFVPTESTHGRHVYTFDSRVVESHNNISEIREILLWDLAGQPGYRLIHQLHLDEVALALIVFDAHSETDPFSGAYYWDRALRLAQRVRPVNTEASMKKFLVAARLDCGGKSVTQARIDSIIQERGFNGYFETSAKEGWGVEALIQAIHNVINWEHLPEVSSTELFQRIKTFLVSQKETEQRLFTMLSTVDNLYHAFLSANILLPKVEDLRTQFETCIGRVESRGLMRRLSFGNLVLLEPELLDAYASALVNSVRDEPDGLGSILEEKVRECDFLMPEDERIANREQEKLLLIAMIEDLLRYEIALREQGEDGVYLVFPSQSTREHPSLPDPEGKRVSFYFEGPVLNIYATLAVRLSHSGLFSKKELWKNAVTYTTKLGGTYGMFLDNVQEGKAELTLFFDKETRNETHFYFEEYVKVHLQRRALPESIKRHCIFTCNECGTFVTEQIVRMRKERGFNWIVCPVCAKKVLLLDNEREITAGATSQVLQMDHVADNRRDQDAAKLIVQGKRETRDFDVFLCHQDVDKPTVKFFGEKLKLQGILPWLDEWELRPGLPWQPVLEKQIRQIKTVAVFIGTSGIGPWQQREVEAFLREFVRRGCPIIPVLLPEAVKEPELPLFLEGMTWVDFRKDDPDPMAQLMWGITGEQFLGQ